MCGNGLRCVALHLAAKADRDEAEFLVDTDAGTLSCRVSGGNVEVDMGRLVDQGAVEVAIAGKPHRFSRISAGNPPAGTLVRYPEHGTHQVGHHFAAAPCLPDGSPA